MPKKLIFALIVFIATISIYLFVKLSDVKDSKTFSLSIKSPTPTPSAQSSLSLLPNPLIITSGQTASVDIIIDSNVNPTLVQLEIGYDPRVVFNVNILPGNYFSAPEIVLENVDAKNGRISYALKAKSVNTDAKTVATVNFSTLNLSQQKTTMFSFLPKTSLKSNNMDITLSGTKPSAIILKPSFYAPPASPSGATITQ